MKRRKNVKANFIYLIIAILCAFLLGFNLGRGANKKTEQLIRPEAEVQEITPTPTSTPKPKLSYYYGKASWYDAIFDGQNCDDKDCIMANGQPYNPYALTTACPNRFPLGTVFRVTYQEKSIKVVCTDRGAFEKIWGRALDLSKESFKALAPLSQGVIWAEIEEIKND